jgi:hypothetical protein
MRSSPAVCCGTNKNSAMAEEGDMEYRTISADDHIDMQWLPKDL